MTFVTDTNIKITKIKPDSAPENSSSERHQTTASVAAVNRICLFLQAEHCPRGICNQHTKQNKDHTKSHEPTSPGTFISYIDTIFLSSNYLSSSWLSGPPPPPPQSDCSHGKRTGLVFFFFVLSRLTLFTVCNHTNDFSWLLKVTVKRGRTENLKVMNTSMVINVFMPVPSTPRGQKRFWLMLVAGS